MALAYRTSSRGACHLRAYHISQEILRKPVATDRFSFDGKARLIKISEDTNAVVDSLSVCKFAFLARPSRIRPVAGRATGIAYTGQGLLKMGEEIIARSGLQQVERFGEKDDFLPERFFTDEGSSGEDRCSRPGQGAVHRRAGTVL